MRIQLRETVSYGVIWLLFPVLTVVFCFGFSALKGIKEATLEQCLPVVVAAQIDMTAENEVLKAQSILTRSSLYKAVKEQGLSLSKLQKWCQQQLQYRDLSYAVFYKKVVGICRETRGIMLWYGDQVCYGAFFALGKGSTRDGFSVFQDQEYGYLTAVSLPEKVQSKIIYYDQEQLKNLLSQWYPDAFAWADSLEGQLAVCETDAAGYVTQVKLGSYYISGTDLTSRLELPSACFLLEEEKGQWRITCYGQGHGFGMDQAYANTLAKNGYTVQRILKYFFPEAELRK